jgi:hypothetical protein
MRRCGCSPTRGPSEAFHDRRHAARSGLADDRYINFGRGRAGLQGVARHRESGVKIGEHFFRGVVKEQSGCELLRASHDAPPGTKAASSRPTRPATRARCAFPTAEEREVPQSTIAISDSFLENKVRLLADVAKRQDRRRRVRRREQDVRKRTRTASPRSRATPRRRSSGRVPSSSSATRRWAISSRTYTYKGALDNAYHLGYDLSVTKNDPIEAANS